jgi:septal ring factor EnvC (AmiA/AmiB activator)
MFGTLLREKHLVKSKALAENNPNAVANELDKATKRITDLEKILSEKNEEIVSLNERVEELEKDNTSLSKELEKATKKSKKNSENE